MSTKKVTAKWLKQIRIAKGFGKQLHFANEAGLHHSLISRYESGGKPDKENIEKLKKALKLSTEERGDFDRWVAGRERMAKKNGNGKKKKATKKSSHPNGKSKAFSPVKKTKIPAGNVGVKDAEKFAKIIGELGGSISLKNANDILKMLVESR